MIRKTDGIQNMARAIFNYGWESLSYTEESALMDSRIMEEVIRRVEELKREKKEQEERAVRVKKEQEERAQRIKEDEKILSKKRPVSLINQLNDMRSNIEDKESETGGILVVDDIKADLDKLKKYLSQTGLPVHSAMNHKDALDILNRYPISMLVTDIVFPMYRMSTKEYTAWEEQFTTSHKYILYGLSKMQVEVKRTKLVKEETKNYSEFAGFKLLDDARKLLPWLPVIIVSRYADLNMACEAFASQEHTKVQYILSKDDLNNPDKLLASVISHMVPIHKRIAYLGRERILEYLSSTSEESFTLKVLVPLFHKLGYKGIRYVHGVNECGIDLICYMEDPWGKRRYYGVQVKAEKIHKNVGDPTSHNILTIIHQVQQALETTFFLPSENDGLNLDRIFIICSRDITHNAKEYIQNVVRDRKCNENQITFMDAVEITDQIINNK